MLHVNLSISCVVYLYVLYKVCCTLIYLSHVLCTYMYKVCRTLIYTYRCTTCVMYVQKNLNIWNTNHCGITRHWDSIYGVLNVDSYIYVRNTWDMLYMCRHTWIYDIEIITALQVIEIVYTGVSHLDLYIYVHNIWDMLYTCRKTCIYDIHIIAALQVIEIMCKVCRMLIYAYMYTTREIYYTRSERLVYMK